MIHTLTAALIKDIISFLKKEKDFLKLSAEEQEKKAPSISAVLAGMNEEEFVNDLEITVKVLRDSANMSESKIIHSITEYFLKDFPQIFDELDSQFYRLAESGQEQKLRQLLPEQGRFFAALRNVLLVQSSQELTESLVAVLNKIYESPRILIQSPVECSRETKTAIRQHFAEKYPQSFVAFSINAQLIGGTRFFIDGKVEDRSWFSKIQAIHRLSELV